METTYEHFRIERLTDGVYAALGIPGKAAGSNAGIINLGDQTIVFDTFVNTLAAEELLDACRRLTGREPAFVLNSHGHSDHWGGNQVFAPFATVMSTEATRELMQEGIDEWMNELIADPQLLVDHISTLEEKIADTPDGPLKQSLRQSLAGQKYALDTVANLKPFLPTETINDGYEFKGSERSAVARVVENCHTRSDCYLALPDDRIAFMGDLAFFQSHPFLLDSNPENWCAQLDRLVRKDLGRCVPGHGPVGKVDDLRLVRKYTVALISIADDAVDQDLSEEDISSIAVPSPFDQWIDGYARFERNLRFLFSRNRPSER